MSRYRMIASANLLALMFLLTTSSAWAQSLQNDAFVSAEITRTGQVDPYTFTASVGDLVFITAADVDNTFLSPTLRLFDPGGIEVLSAVDTLTAEIIAYEVLSDGQHTVLMQDSGVDNVGKYSLYFVRVLGTNELGRLQNDTRLAERLDLGDIDTFTFEAAAGDHIHLNVADKNNTFLSPVIRLYDPTGALFDSDSDTLTATLRDVEINRTGVWTVVLNDSGSDNVGDYDLFFTSLPGAIEKGILPNDARRSAELSLGDVDTWVFDATAGDRIHLSAADVNNTFLSPDLLLYDPQGVVVAEDSDTLTAFISGFTIAQDGRYSVVVKDSGADNVGRYELHFALVPGASEGGTLTGSTAGQGRLTLGDIDTFEFGARAGATVILNVADVNNTFLSPQVIIYGEDGTVVASDTDTLSAAISFVVADTGFYTVVLQDSGLDNVGDYTLDYLYIGASPPVRTRSVVLEPTVWHLLGVPGNTGGTLGELFSPNFNLASYDDTAAAGGWVMFGYEALAANPATGTPGAYRKLSLSEPVPQGTGFWLIHLSDSAVRVNLPVSATDATGTPGGGCPMGFSCFSTPLEAPDTGGWTIGTVPSTLIPSVDTFRFLTDASAPLCVDGCTLQDAADVGYAAPNGIFVYESKTDRYRLRADTDSLASWTGFWVRANTPSVPGSPQLLLPVR